MNRRLDMVLGGIGIRRRITEIITESITETIGTGRRLRPRIERHHRRITVGKFHATK